MADGTTRVAVIQAGSVLFDTPRTLEKLLRLTREAAENGARLALFPEAFLGGYPKGIDFGVRVGSRSPDGRRWFQRYFAAAVDVPGPETDEIAALSAELGIDLVVGAIERGGSTLYCTALFFTPSEGLAAKHRKLMPTAMERLIWGQGDGSTIVSVAGAAGRMGAVICWENYMPLLRTAMYAQGVEVYCAPTVDDRDTWPATMTHIACEGRCFVLSAVQYLTRADAPADYEPIQGSGPDVVLIRGGSIIVDPLGTVLAGPIYGAEQILYADIDLGRIAQARFDLDPVGHYARPDIFSLTVDRSPRSAVAVREADRGES